MRVRVTSLIQALPGILAALGVVAGSSLFTPHAAQAAAYTYGARQRTVNAGILVVDDNTPQNSGNIDGAGTANASAADSAPYVFYILNEREDMKPFGWNIVNPLAPRTVTGDILTRWNNRMTVGPGYTLNQPITPNMAAYWEVRLSKMSLTDLEQFNVLLLPIANGHTVAFTDTEVNLLRRYVDNGGQLWIEDSGSGHITTAPGQGLFLDATFGGGSSGQFILPTVTGAPGSLPLHQPIISTPYFLQPSDLNTLGGQNAFAHAQYIQSALSPGTSPDAILSSALLNPANTASNNQPFPVISTAQYGAGQVIMEAVCSAQSINGSVGGTQDIVKEPNTGPYSGTTFAAAPGPDMKFAYDIMSWSSAHPQPYKTSHQSSSSTNTLGPAVTPLWTYPLASRGVSAPGAAVTGSFVYVRDASGYLDAFNATPGTNIISGTLSPDVGYVDYANGSPWDLVWDSTGLHNFPNAGSAIGFHDPNGSGPTVATIPTGQTLVFVEDSTGKVYAADATTGLPYPALSGGAGNGGAGNGGTYTAADPAPAPTYFGGRLFCGQPNGKLFVYDFRTDTSATYTVDPNSQPVIASPTVGFVSENIHDAGYVDDLVVTVTTPLGTYTLQGGARHDLLTLPPGSNVYVPQPANGVGPFRLETGIVGSEAYTDLGGYKNVLATTNTAQGFSPSTPPNGTFMGDYDTDFQNSPSGAAGSSLERAEFAFNGSTTAAGTAQSSSTPVLDVNGNYYYIVNIPSTFNGQAVIDSTLVCAHEGRTTELNPAGRLSPNQMHWRFRLPFAGEAASLDADGISYAALDGYHFVGTPVVDNEGHVFALATNGSQSAVLCFNATQNVTLQLNATGTAHVSQLSQSVPGSTAGTDEFGNTPAAAISNGTQFNGVVNGIGRMLIQSFGANSNSLSGGTIITPNLSEPQPVEATYNISSANAATQTAVAPLHTNIAWYAILPGNVALANNTGPALVGNYLFFGDTAGNLYRLFAYPQSQNLVLPTRQTPLVGPTGAILQTNDGHPLVASVLTGVGQITDVVSAGNSVIIANGVAGVEAYGSQFTLVSDANRIMEVDSEGVAQWVVDSTTELNPLTGRATHVPFNHPADLTQITPNNYLVADTGNNRCVEFDRAGNVLWEMTRFNDAPLVTSNGSPIIFYRDTAGVAATKTRPLLAPGEPLTLSHPTGITSYVQNIPEGTIVHYLISDTGNNRILDIVYVYDTKGNLVGTPGNLVWVSHTADALGRRYAYTNAHYFVGPNGENYIAALVGNVRVAPPLTNSSGQPTGQMASVSQDAPGSSIVLLDYDPANYLGSPNYFAATATQHDGMISHAISAFLGYFSSGRFNLAGSPKVVAPTTPNGNPTVLPATAAPTLVYLRNPRFLETYTPPGAGSGGTPSPVQNFLLADDNGVYDLFLDPTGGDSGASSPAQFRNFLEAQWGMTPLDYQSLLNAQGGVAPIPGTLASDGSGQLVPVARNGDSVVVTNANPLTYGYGPQVLPPLPFVPNSLTRTGTDPVTMGGVNYLMGRYIISNGYSQGGVTPLTGFGGEVDELAVSDYTGTPLTYLVGSFGKLTGNNAAPLSQPSAALREK